jgi:cytosine/adenosine deaminase-related metal-dependent hydrolase
MNSGFDVYPDGLVYVDKDHIVAVHPADANAPTGFDGPVVATAGTLYPGFIDLDNHLPYGILPLWDVPKRFANRNQMSSHPEYRRTISWPMMVLGQTPQLAGAIAVYAQCKCLFSGVTTSQGLSLFSNAGLRRYHRGWLRNLHKTDDPLLPKATARIIDVSPGDAPKVLHSLQKATCLLMHLADGVDESAHRQFELLALSDGRWAISSALAAVHCTALGKKDYAILAENAASMVWTPFHDLLLYGVSADIRSASEAGVQIALASVGSPWGSKNLLGELKVARLLSEQLDGLFDDRALLAMATCNPAHILKWDRALGSIEPGKRADLVVLSGQDGDPYERPFLVDEQAIILTVVNGIARYGAPEQMGRLKAVADRVLGQQEGPATVRVGSAERALDLRLMQGDEIIPSMSFTEASERLAEGMQDVEALARAAGAEGGKRSRTKTSPVSEGQPVEWRLDGVSVAELATDDIPRSLSLDPPTVADDPDFFDRIARQVNLPNYLKEGLPRLYCRPPALLRGGYKTDAICVEDEDELGISAEVNMLCSVMASADIRPPLSIGLFGAWGTGKSFFMREMQRRIAYMEQNDSASCKGIVQIRFNAWHYADASLWPSLAVEIFERIADPEPITREQIDQHDKQMGEEVAARALRRKKLREQLEVFQEVKADVDRNLGELLEQKQRLNENLDRARQERLDKARELGAVKARRLLDALSEDQEAQKLRDSAAEKLGVQLAWSEMSAIASDMRRLGATAGVIWRRLAAGRTATPTLLMTMAFVVAVAAGLVLLASPALEKLLSLVPLGAASLLLRTLAPRVRRVLEEVQQGLAFLDRAIARAEQVEAEFIGRLSRQEIELQTKMSILNRREEEFQGQLRSLHDRETEVRREVSDLEEGKRLYAFLAERVASTDYQRQLGVISMIRRDFAKLDNLLLCQRAGTIKTLPRVERIILYIDDLDRCEPGRVVEVLQAVHLLMALPLFIVVVAVDPWWLLRSLRQRYRSILAPTTGQAGTASEELLATPRQYLEKVFQIAFTLPAMTDKGFARLVASFAPRTQPAHGDPLELPGESEAPNVEPGTPASPTPEAPLAPTGAGVTRGSIHVEAGSAADRVVSAQSSDIDLTDTEVRFAMRLRPLVDTPRSTKRLINCYRLLRATRYTGTVSAFLGREGVGGEHQAVLQLLAIMGGFPVLADGVMAALERAPARLPWSKFVAAMEPHPFTRRDSSRGMIGNGIVGATGHLTEDWHKLHVALGRVLPHVTLVDDIRTYKVWAPIVARFSFLL